MPERRPPSWNTAASSATASLSWSREVAVEKRLLEEEEDRLRVAEADERGAKLRITVARANRDAGEAAVREAEASYDIARAGSRVPPDVEAEDALEVAREQRIVAEHRVEQARADTARAASAREYRGKQFDRITELAKRGAVEQRLVDEEQDRFEAAREEEAAAKSAIAAARAGLDHTEAAIREAEARRDLAIAGARPPRGPGAARSPSS